MTKFAAIQTVSTPDVARNLEPPPAASSRRPRRPARSGWRCPSTSA